MAAWIASAWGQVWPNLAANVLWVPLAALHHLAIKRHSRRLHAQYRQHIEALIKKKEDTDGTHALS